MTPTKQRKAKTLYYHYNHAVDLSGCGYWKKDKETMAIYDNFATLLARTNHENLEILKMNILVPLLTEPSMDMCMGAIYYKFCPECKRKIYDESRTYLGKSSFKPPKSKKKKKPKRKKFLGII